jgi:alkylated DNA nucleotide flippase Atl1
MHTRTHTQELDWKFQQEVAAGKLAATEAATQRERLRAELIASSDALQEQLKSLKLQLDVSSAAR